MYRSIPFVVSLCLSSSVFATQVHVRDLALVEEEIAEAHANGSLDSVISGNFPNSITSGNFPNAVTEGNFPNAVTSGNFPEPTPTVISANFPNTVTSGNFPNTITAGNFPNTVTEGRFPDSFISNDSWEENLQGRLDMLPVPEDRTVGN